MYNESDEARALHAEQVGDDSLVRVLTAARAVCNVLEDRWSSNEFAPSFSVELETGADGEPVLTFIIGLQLSDDFATDDWPGDAVEKMKDDLRLKARTADLAAVSWYVAVMTVDTLARRGD